MSDPIPLEMGANFPNATKNRDGRYPLIVETVKHPGTVWSALHIHCSACGNSKPRGNGVLLTQEPMGPGVKFYWLCGVCVRKIVRAANV